MYNSDAESLYTFHMTLYMYLISLKFYIYFVTYRVIRNAEGDLRSIQHCLLQTLHCIRIPVNLIQSLTELLV